MSGAQIVNGVCCYQESPRPAQRTCWPSMQLISVEGIFAHQVKLITYLGTAPMPSGANVAAFGGRES